MVKQKKTKQMKTKPFNKERAIAGDPVVDTTGQRWEFLEDDGDNVLPLWFKHSEKGNISCFTNNGNYYINDENYRDLSMLDTTP